MNDRKLLVLGLDGLDRKFIEDNREKLPGFDSIFGQTAFLESTLPPVTVPAWQSSFTGLRPERLDQFDFQVLDFDDYSFGPREPGWEGREFWSYTSGKTALINVPRATLRDNPGWKVGGIFDIGKGSTEPPGLYREMEKDLGDLEIKGLENYSSEKRKRKKAFEFFEKRREMLEWFLENRDADVYFPVFRLPDTMMHHCSSDRDMLEAYRACDEMLQDLMEKDLDIMVLSDHGAVKATRRFSVNTWLRKNGYLETRSPEDGGTGGGLKGKVGDRLRSMALELAELGERFGLRDYLVRANELYEDAMGEAFVEANLDLDSVDWSNTEAFSYMTGVCSYSGIWINDHRFPDPAVGDCDAKKRELKQKLEQHDLVEEVLLKQDAFVEDAESFPDLVAVLSEKVKNDSDIKPSVTGKISSYMHRKEGFIGVHGEGFNLRETEAELIDLAPTVLHYLGEDIPEEMDGQVMDLFSRDSNPYNRQPSYSSEDVSGLDF